MRNPRAFTLVETLIAISIVTIAVVGPLLTASRTLVAAYIARDQLTASYLASEAVDYVHSMRDAMYLADYEADPSDTALSADAFCDFSDPNPSADCAIAPASSASVASCVGSGNGTTLCMLGNPLAPMGVGAGSALRVCGASCSPLYLNVNGRYTIAKNGTATTFVRTIRFYTVGTELDVVVSVSWQERGIAYSTSLNDYLSPWQ